MEGMLLDSICLDKESTKSETPFNLITQNQIARPKNESHRPAIFPESTKLKISSSKHAKCAAPSPSSSTKVAQLHERLLADYQSINGVGSQCHAAASVDSLPSSCSVHCSVRASHLCQVCHAKLCDVCVAANERHCGQPIRQLDEAAAISDCVRRLAQNILRFNWFDEKMESAKREFAQQRRSLARQVRRIHEEIDLEFDDLIGRLNTMRRAAKREVDNTADQFVVGGAREEEASTNCSPLTQLSVMQEDVRQFGRFVALPATSLFAKHRKHDHHLNNIHHQNAVCGGGGGADLFEIEEAMRRKLLEYTRSDVAARIDRELRPCRLALHLRWSRAWRNLAAGNFANSECNDSMRPSTMRNAKSGSSQLVTVGVRVTPRPFSLLEQRRIAAPPHREGGGGGGEQLEWCRAVRVDRDSIAVFDEKRGVVQLVQHDDAIVRSIATSISNDGGGRRRGGGGGIALASVRVCDDANLLAISDLVNSKLVVLDISSGLELAEFGVDNCLEVLPWCPPSHTHMHTHSHMHTHTAQQPHYSTKLVESEAPPILFSSPAPPPPAAPPHAGEKLLPGFLLVCPDRLEHLQLTSASSSPSSSSFSNLLQLRLCKQNPDIELEPPLPLEEISSSLLSSSSPLLSDWTHQVHADLNRSSGILVVGVASLLCLYFAQSGKMLRKIAEDFMKFGRIVGVQIMQNGCGEDDELAVDDDVDDDDVDDDDDNCSANNRVRKNEEAARRRDSILVCDEWKNGNGRLIRLDKYGKRCAEILVGHKHDRELSSTSQISSPIAMLLDVEDDQESLVVLEAEGVLKRFAC